MCVCVCVCHNVKSTLRPWYHFRYRYQAHFLDVALAGIICIIISFLLNIMMYLSPLENEMTDGTRLSIGQEKARS